MATSRFSFNGKSEMLNSGSLALFTNEPACQMRILPTSTVSVVWIRIIGRDFRGG